MPSATTTVAFIVVASAVETEHPKNSPTYSRAAFGDGATLPPLQNKKKCQMPNVALKKIIGFHL
jgi:hypothetical protein